MHVSKDELKTNISTYNISLITFRNIIRIKKIVYAMPLSKVFKPESVPLSSE
ncbi:hypothetical protein GCM10022210_49460 [Mucilaginibacter dorajii]|uniref:Uncharacterized protein n=1 Tax=Mucilaginibacter dorajii TaxID=692994 RepID=A0ABP7QZG2_9SPHI